MTENKDNLMVAVWMVTYNHESYIEKAIESVIGQKTAFKFKLIISEDHSTDTTRQICENYAQKHNHLIELHAHENNIGSSANGLYTFKCCLESGAKYVALCEGDDYWTDPFKLQKQVDFLEANPDHNICFHNSNVGVSIEDSNIFPKDTYTLSSSISSNDIVKMEWCMPTSSLVFRNKLKDIPLDMLGKFHVGDIPLIYFLLGADSRAGYINETMSFYRQHDGGISRDHFRVNIKFLSQRYYLYLSLNKYFKGSIDFSYQLDRYLGLIIDSYYRKYTKAIYRRIGSLLKIIFRFWINRNILRKYT